MVAPLKAVVAGAGAALAATVTAVETIPPPTAWSGNDVALVVAAFFTGLTLLLTQLLNLYFTQRAKKQIDVVHEIVNGTNTLLVNAVERKDAKIAGLTGGIGDRREADVSAKAADAKREVMASIEKKP